MKNLDTPAIQVREDLTLSMIRPEDEEELVAYLNDRTIYENTCNVPYPYRAKDAEQYIRDEYFFMDTHGKWRSLAIRSGGRLIGGIGLMYNHGVRSFKSEFGYWLGKPFRGRGVMTQVVRCFSDHCLKNLGLIRLEANVFRYNESSMKVLEKSGFQLEGVLEKAYEKDGIYIDSLLYAKVRENWAVKPKSQDL